MEIIREIIKESLSKKYKVFLGGTTNESTWREKIIPMLKIDYFDPVVKDWNEKAYKKELKERKNSDFCLYVITPKMAGVYSIAEVIDDANNQPDKTIFCFLKNDGKKSFNESQIKSLEAVGKMVVRRKGKWLKNLEEIANYLNKFNR